MPGFRKPDLPVTVQRGAFCQRATRAGGMAIAFEDVPAADYGGAGACLDAHWGYVFKGRARVTYPDGEETLEAGQAYHLRAGHRIAVLEDSEVVEFSLAPPSALPPLAVALGFLDAINRNDLARLAQLLAPDHRMALFDEPPTVGREAVFAAWAAYLGAWPAYVVHPERFAEAGPRIGILGTTTGSHLGRPDAVERKEALVWIAEIADGAIATWTMLPDTPANRALAGF